MKIEGRKNGFELLKFPQHITFGFTFSWDQKRKLNYDRNAPNCLSIWLSVNFICWQLSYSRVVKVYGVQGLVGAG